jgi:glycosyltransferase involved in cell wall biosynthesis
MGSQRDKLAVIVARMGPYHVAKLAALARAYGAEHVVALEVASSDTTYDWDPVSAAGFRRVTLIRDASYEAAGALRRAREITAALEREAPDAVGVNGWAFPEARAALRWCRRNRRIAVLMSDSQAHDRRRFFLKEWVKSAIVRQFDSALVPGPRHERYVRSLGLPGSAIAYGYDVVDNEHFLVGAESARKDTNARKKLGLPVRYFLTVARFIPEKNLPTFLLSYAVYRRLCGEDAWHLVLLGDGSSREYLRRLSMNIGISAYVHMPGFQQYAVLPAYYGLASAFVLPSISEPWGLVVNEAMASGLPVLVSKSCGSVQLVKEGINGWSFDPTSSDEIASAMLRVTRLGPDLDAFSSASKRIIADFTPEIFARGFLKAVELGRRSSRRHHLSRIAARIPGW